MTTECTCGHDKLSHMIGSSTECLRCECKEYRQMTEDSEGEVNLVVHMSGEPGKTRLKTAEGKEVAGVRTVDIKDAHPTLEGMKRLVTVTLINPEVKLDG